MGKVGGKNPPDGSHLGTDGLNFQFVPQICMILGLIYLINSQTVKEEINNSSENIIRITEEWTLLKFQPHITRNNKYYK